eukprot:TRINITY_DN2339_c0_g1_i1.p1 TRINITY_DN2339_c0_g1~~TRINITY_DN2339_c0_g1_i1.p1  ORF type:complete len:313 (+),score=93.08 TRINITY_DN2339_c0_g1_i1:282-1220(+)
MKRPNSTNYMPITVLIAMNFLTWWIYSGTISGLYSELEKAKSGQPASSSVIHQAATSDPSQHWSGVTIPLFKTDPSGRKIRFPVGVKRVWIDVGAHKESMMCRPALDDQKDLAVIAVEPLYDNWGYLTIKNHHDRLITIPAAVSPVEGYATFRKAGTDMCSSLLEVNPDALRKDWPGGCTETSFEFQVATVRLETIIGLIPSNIAIEFVKVDAQGSDYDVIASGGTAMKRVGAAVIEIQLKKALYVNAKSEEEHIELFRSVGFSHISTKIQNREGTEANMYFTNKKMKQPEKDVLPISVIMRDIDSPKDDFE